MKRKYADLLAKIRDGQTIKWNDAKSLLIHLGASIKEREGSRVVITLDGRKLNMHKPHPGNDLLDYQVRDLKKFLE